MQSGDAAGHSSLGALKAMALLLAGVALLTGLGLAWRQLQQREARTLRLPDGSQLTLLKVTRGQNHTCRFGSRAQDWLHPLLPQKLRARFPPRLLTFTGVSGDGLMIWLRHDGGSVSPGWPPPYFLAVADEQGLESPLLRGANVTRSLSRTTPGAPAVAPSRIDGWEASEFPRRAKSLGIRVYQQDSSGRMVRVGEFPILNPRSAKFPTWTAASLPAIWQTNKLEITLVRLETGLTTGQTGLGPAAEGARAFSRASFTFKENGAPTEHWGVCRLGLCNAAGEVRTAGTYGSRWERGEHRVDFDGALWVEEEAWKLEVDFARTADFPAEELWFIGDVAVPGERALNAMRLGTNKFGEELEFLGVSRARASLPEGYTSLSPEANLHVRAPYPLENLRLVLVAVTDDRGRRLAQRGLATTTSTGGRGITPKEMLYGFGLEIPEDTRTLNVTLAATRIVSAGFQAKPTLTAPAASN